MRHVPIAIDRVTMKPAPDMIAHSARSHFAQREQGHFEGVLTGLAFRIACVESHQEIERHWSRKFWGVTEAAFLWVVAAVNLLVSGIQDSCVDFPLRSCRRLRFAQGRNNLATLFNNLVVILLPSRRDSFKHVFESRLTVPLLWWKISSSDKWLQVWCQPDTHRPSATARGRLDKGHVNAVNIRPLFPVYFDVHK